MFVFEFFLKGQDRTVPTGGGPHTSSPQTSAYCPFSIGPSEMSITRHDISVWLVNAIICSAS